MAMERCLNCDYEVSHTAKYCPDCGHKLFWTKMKNISLRGFLVSCGIVAVGVVIVVGLIVMDSDETTDGSSQASQTSRSASKDFHHSYARFDSVFGPLTDVQRKERWGKFQGECVEWTGTVQGLDEIEDGGGYLAVIEHPEESYGSGKVNVYYPPDYDFDPQSIDKGSTITYEGTLTDYPRDHVGGDAYLDRTEVTIGC